MIKFSKIFFDTETTGLRPGQIGQLAYIKEQPSGELTAGNYFFSVKKVNKGAEEATGRDAEFYKKASGGITFADKADEILNIFSDSMLIAHNLKFDENFLSTELWRTGKTLVVTPDRRFDTMEYFKDILKLPDPRRRYLGAYKNPRLSELVDAMKLDTHKVHEFTAQLFGINTADYKYHDAMYDTTSMFLAFAVYRDTLNNTDFYKSRYTL